MPTGGNGGKFGRPPAARPPRLHDKGCHTAPAGARAVGLLFLHIYTFFLFPLSHILFRVPTFFYIYIKSASLHVFFQCQTCAISEQYPWKQHV
jgi:hypothetical protein